MTTNQVADQPPTHSDKLPRTWLFVPATRIDRIDKAFASGADAVIVDMEDAVAESQKDSARDALLAYYHDSYLHDSYLPHRQHANSKLSSSQQSLWLRINSANAQQHGRASHHFAADVAACQQMSKLAGVVLPKVQQPNDIERVRHATGLPVLAMIEDATGLYHLDKLARANGVCGFSYGLLDICQGLGVEPDSEAAHLIANQLRYQLLLTSKVHALMPPIDSIYANYEDVAGLQQRVRLWSQMGLSGMLCIHPKQVASVHELLKPSPERLAFARDVVAQYEQTGSTAFAVDGQMVDLPVIQAAQQLLAQYG